MLLVKSALSRRGWRVRLREAFCSVVVLKEDGEAWQGKLGERRGRGS